MSFPLRLYRYLYSGKYEVVAQGLLANYLCFLHTDSRFSLYLINAFIDFTDRRGIQNLHVYLNVIIELSPWGYKFANVWILLLYVRYYVCFM